MSSTSYTFTNSFLEAEAAISDLLKTLEDGDAKVRSYAAFALGQINRFETIIERLMKVVENDEHPDARWSAAKALQNIKDKTLLTPLLTQLRELCCKNGGSELLETIVVIQKRCGFYNYEIVQAAVGRGNRQRAEGRGQEVKPNQGATTMNFYGPVYGVAGTVEGDFKVHPAAQDSDTTEPDDQDVAVKLPNLEDAYIQPQKLTGYLLSEVHPVGASKAKLLRAFGFNETNVAMLEQGLLKIAQTQEVQTVIPTEHGIKYVIDGDIETPEGRPLKLRTVWIIDTELSIPRFVTARPLKLNQENSNDESNS